MMGQQLVSLTIGGLAAACDVSTPTIRYYEKIALLPKADRNQGDQRRYGHEDIERLTFIRRCRAFGFSTKQVRTLVSHTKKTEADCTSSRQIAVARVGDIRARIQDLVALEKSLQKLIDTCDVVCGDDAGRDCVAFREMRLLR
jgi:MerR family copper efflux transcriptional regulator